MDKPELPEQVQFRKMASSNECRMLALMIARFICHEDKEETDVPCAVCLAFGGETVRRMTLRTHVIPVPLDAEEVQEVVMDALGFVVDTKKPDLKLEHGNGVGDDLINRAQRDLKKRKEKADGKDQG